MRFLLALVLVACSQTEPAPVAEDAPTVRAEGPLLYTWYDEDGAHIAETRAEIPEGALQRVKVEDPRVSPEGRDPDRVWVADLRTPRADGTFPVEGMSRSAFDTVLDEAAGVDFEAAAEAAEDVVLYGASWCGACQSAAAFFRRNDVPFVEHDIEENATARAEMQAKARAAGVQTSGIPVIDVRGTLVTGFDERRIRGLLND